MKKYLITAIILITITLTAQQKLEGYKDYKFGMSIEEANSLYDFDKANNIPRYEFSGCITYETSLYSFDFEVMLFFKKNELSIITLTHLDTLQTCTGLYDSLLNALLIKYGDHYYIKKRSNDFNRDIWSFPAGGMIEMQYLINYKKSGAMITINYLDSDTL